MRITEFETGPLGANCFCVTENGIDAVLIDVGGADDELLEYIKNNELNIKAILLTHGHFDHIGGAAKLREITGAKIYIHDYDAELTDSREKSLASWVPPQYFAPFVADYKFNGDDVIECAGMKFTVLHTPGHTRGSSCFIVNDNIFCGDALFKGSIGRSDVYGSDPMMQRAALAQFSELSGDYTLYCGHGATTTLSYELKTNPYLLDFRR